MKKIVKQRFGQSRALPFEKYGMNLDLRVQVMSVERVLELIETMHSFEMNVLLIEWEATFPFHRHATICNQYAYTAEEVSVILTACREAGIEVIPLQQCFGHVEYILMHNRYASLRENTRDLSQVCPLKADAAIEVFEEIFSELIEHHDSDYFHIGGDETRLLGHCPECAELVRNEGKAPLYTSYVLRLIEMLKGLGKTPVIWADMLLKYPELIEKLPRDLILIDWNYGWKVDRFGDVSELLKSGFEIWGAPALRSAPDNHSKTYWARHFNNLKDFVPHAKAQGYTGMIQTSWSTSGEYGYLMDHENVVAKLLPIRRVYPLTGFRILIEAFAVSVCGDEPLDPLAFIQSYGAERFALNEADAGLLAQLLLKTSDYENAAHMLRQSDSWLLELDGIDPRSNVDEFAHLHLIIRMSMHGLKVSDLNEQFQLLGSDAQLILQLQATANELLEQAQQLDAEFRVLNGSTLALAELDEEMHYRQALLRGLTARIERLQVRAANLLL
jgi:hypothetical protein